MKTLKKAVGFVTKAIGAVMGANLPNPVDLLWKDFPYAAFAR